MRKFILALAILASLITGAFGKTGIFVLAPDFSEPKDVLTRSIAEAILALAPDDRLLIVSARPYAVISAISVPKGPNASNPAWVKRKLGEQAAPALRYIAGLPSVSTTDPPGNLMIPTVVDELARNVIPGLPDKNVDVMMLGSLLYFDLRDDRWSMMDRFYPSDGELYADPAKSPFSVIDKKDRLRGSTFHYCSPVGLDQFVSLEHEAKVRRFQSLWTTEQGGRVGTFSYDLATCTRRFVAGDASGQPTYQAKRDAKPEMIRAHLPVPSTLPASMATPGPYFMRDDVPISRIPPTRTSGIAWIGLKWKANCDVDLYARPDGKSQWLYYGNPRTNQGFLNKDWREAVDQGQFEYVEFKQPVDLKITEVAINFYSGQLPTGPEGMVRVWFDSKVYEAPFKLVARSGNSGQQPMSGPYWLKIDLRKVLGLTAS